MVFFNQRLILRFVFCTLVSITSFANLLCENVLKTSAVISTETRNLMTALHSQSDLVQAILQPSSTKIQWDTFNSITSIKPTIIQYATYLKGLTPEQLILERQSLDRYLQDNPLDAQVFAQLATIQNISYAPAQYKLRTNFIREIIALIRLLPPEFRPRIARPGFDQRRSKINQEAEDFMTSLVHRFDELFNQQSGYSSYAAYEKTLRESKNQWIQLAISMIDQNHVDVAIRRPESGRFWVPKVGFQNQFVTGSSKGTFDPFKRNTGEATLTSATIDKYKEFDDEFKPKYGTLKASEASGVFNDFFQTWQYGDDVYTLKLEDVQKRLSFFMDDSLAAGIYEDLGSVPPTKKNEPTKEWTRLFNPWSRRLVMAPLLARSLEGKQFDLIKGESWIDFPLNINTQALRVYWETQIFGQVTLDMVKSFLFTTSPPEGEFLAELLKRKIIIYDGRTTPPKLWQAP